MRDDFLDAMSGSKGISDYTLEEIEAAEKRKKKKGGSLSDNLIAVTGRAPSVHASSLPDLFSVPSLSAGTGSAASSASSDTKSADSALDPAQQQLLKNQQALNDELAKLNSSIASDFGIGTSKGSMIKAMDESVAASPVKAVKPQEEKPALLEGEEALDAFAGVSDELEKELLGQKEFLRKLIISLKRPFVMPPQDGRAKNSVLMIGADDTGKRYALGLLAKELKKRRLLSSENIKTVDLGIYTDAAQEKVFLQDMYSALSGEAEILLFEHFETCHPSFLSHISSLVTQGFFRLSERYMMQNGQLISVQNAMASETVGSLNARGKYLFFVSERSLDKTAGILGAPFVDALGDICETAALDSDAIRGIAQRELDEIKTKAKERFFFDIDFSEDFLDSSIEKAGRKGLKGVQAFYDSLLQALAQARLEGDYAKGCQMTIRIADGKLTADAGEETIDLQAFLPEQFTGEIDEIKKEMDEIVGLSEVKKYILSLEEYYQVQKRRDAEGLKTGEVSKHMIFTGNPGTGKTTIARIVSKYLKAIGVLSGGQLVEVSRADLVGRYVGHTAPLTNKVISSAIGGVLFIDEAYSLYRGKEDTFGLEAIDTLVKGIEDNRDNLIVILAGYSIEMEEFLTANSGLKSRFPNVIHFPDYTGEELLKISQSIAKSKGYTIDEKANEALCAYFDGVQALGAADAGNGRLARNLVEEAILNQSRRLVAEPDADLSTLTEADFSLEEEG